MTRTVKTPVEQSAGAQKLHRGLGKRHVQLIAIGGAIGTGLFMGTGKTIAVSGTSIILTYLLIGFFAFMVMRAMGELLLTKLDYRTFADFVADYLGEKASYFLGWTYWMSWVVSCIADVVVCGGYIQYWFPDVSLWFTALSLLGLICLCNFFSVRLFGETEFWFAMIKVVAIVALIIVGVGMVFVGWTSPNGVTASVRHLTDPEVFLPNGMFGFLAGFQIAIFSFTGIELVGTVTAETKEPEKVLPKAINTIPIRIIIFYVLSIMCIIAVTSWQNISPEVSPFVTLFALAGLPAAAAVINFVALTSAMSSANSGLYACTRMLYGLSTEKLAHGKFAQLSVSSAVPVFSLIFSVICMASGVFLLFIVPNVMKLFTIVSTVAAIMVIYSWGMILIAYLAYRKKRPDLHKISIYKMPMGIPMTWCTLIFFAFTVVIMVFDYDTRIALYGTPIWFVVLEVLWRMRKNRDQRAAEERMAN
ncbi:amino acid permease [Xenorhabdus bovienii]|uniref:D-alanine/D-serine/glycine transport protein (APC family) n=1 Tax=Xenorhabdus bovienii str. Intermedium TaxID=1379677 RepID=A0A077QPL0_XENBV|nr:amino acid permease [Xenorhabdus bovienii]MDE9453685.1 amino acid permease [Xenorhabdus bovienii]MDE9480264.1 amino acid permease [Xenorhabdus bovienii]MDE9533760.1 amino acid permease [Xenorhabdus bovienii]MDE9542631.1 amino acid permease [Xenorhabdus bovienii]MDE9551709.1 amino acid permease [Xenorhabdus bovienii]